MKITNNFKLSFPKSTLIGFGALERLGEELRAKGLSRCLLVTDKFMAESGVAQKVSDILNKFNIQLSVYSGVKPDPTLEQVREGVSEFLNNSCDSIISLGGGSPHDCAKAVKLTVLKGGLTKRSELVLTAVNTTAGTASEVTKFAIIKDEEKHYKLSLVDESIIPDIAVDDTELMLNMPPKLTAATGMDALTHAVEAFVAKDRNYFTDCTALKAIELIHKFLVRAYKDGCDIEAREGMAYAQYLAGLAFSNAGLGLVHAMAHQLGGLYGLPHGLCNAVLLPYVLDANSVAVSSSYGTIAKTIGLCEKAIPDKTASRILIGYVRGLNKQLQIPGSTKELGVKYEDCETLAKMAMEDPSLKMNPMEIKEEDLLKIYQKAYKHLI